MKTAELKGLDLDAAVAMADGCVTDDGYYLVSNAKDGVYRNIRPEHYSTNWTKGGHILDRECFDFHCNANRTEWTAEAWGRGVNGNAELIATQYGKTMLEAGMRCFVAAKLGEEFEFHPRIEISKAG